MNIRKYRSILANVFAENTFFKIAVVVSLSVNVLLAGGIIAALNSSRTILLPPEIDKSFWVERDQVSKEYLEQMALFISQLELNVTPASHGYQTRVLLNYIHPSYHGKMQSKFLADGEQLKKDNASTWFTPRMIQTDVKDKAVAITGEFMVTVAEKQVVKQNKTYLAKFDMNGSKLFLTKFEEVNGDAFRQEGEQPAKGTPAKKRPSRG